MNNKVLGLFFTEGVSVKVWRDRGLLDREKLLYEKLLDRDISKSILWFTYGTDDKSYEANIDRRITIVPKPKLFYGNLGSRLYSWLLPFIQYSKLKKCDVYKTNQMPGAWTAVIAKWLFHKPLFVRTGYTVSLFLKRKHKYLKYFFYTLIERFVYRNAKYIAVSSQADKNYIQNKYKVSDVKVLYNYIATDIFRPMNTVKNKDIIFVGRFSKQKNLVTLFDALKELKYTVDLYGSGEMEAELKILAHKLGIRANFMSPMPNTEMPNVLNQYKLYVLCSQYEGMPKTLLEAMACGVACLGTDVAGINEIIDHDKNGWLVKNEVDQISAGIDWLMKNEALRSRLGAAARDSIVEKFSLDKIINQERAIYE